MEILYKLKLAAFHQDKSREVSGIRYLLRYSSPILENVRSTKTISKKFSSDTYLGLGLIFQLFCVKDLSRFTSAPSEPLLGNCVPKLKTMPCIT